MKKVLELLLCILHPIAVVLIWINLVFRSDLGPIAKLTLRGSSSNGASRPRYC